MSATTTGLSADDKLEIAELLIKFNTILDRGSFEPRSDYLDLFTDDAVLVSPPTGRFEGRAGQEAYAVHNTNAHSADPVADKTRHCITNILVEGSGDAATVEAYVSVIRTTSSKAGRSTSTIGAGWYECTVIRIGGRWRMQTRTLFIDGVTGGPGDRSELDHTEVKALSTTSWWRGSTHTTSTHRRGGEQDATIPVVHSGDARPDRPPNG